MKKTIIVLSIIFTLFGVSFVYAANDYGLGKTAEKAGLDVSERHPEDIIGNVVGAGLTLVGVLFLLLMIYGGVIWMIARGNEQETDKALKTIKAAVLGLIIVVASYAITTFVFDAIKGTDESGGSDSSGSCSEGATCATDADCGLGLGVCWYVCDVSGTLCTEPSSPSTECGGGECTNAKGCFC
ncbi:MAG: pilin [bacterium]|nr:pilin [bacterium]